MADKVIILFIIITHFLAGKGQLCMEGDVRLVSGSSTVTLRAGTVQICINNTWGTICNPYYVGWDSREGGVVCRQLELQPLGAIPQLNYITSTSSDPVWLDNVRCIGNETHLLNCTHSTIGVVSSYCRSSFGYYYAAGVHCLDLVTSLCSDGDIRLVGGATPNEGRVEICYQNSWGTVCDNSWDRREATAVCRQLNLTTIGATPYFGSFYGRGSGGIYLDQVSCSGNEQALINCSHRGVGVHSCTHSEDAGVMCLGTPDNCMDGDVRLVSGRNNLEGTAQVCVFGYWGTICGNSWDSRDAYVVCKQLGYPAVGSVPIRYARFGRGVGPIWLDNVHCLGNESLIFNCSHRGLGITSTYCDHSDDVGVQCVANNMDNCSQGQLRLIGGSSDNEGRVEICYENRWGTICDNGWSNEDAKVVCRQLGFQTVGAIHFSYGSSYFGQGSGGIFLQNLACSGNELMLINCSHSGIGVHSCSHSEDAGVICLGDSTDNCTEGQLRLLSTSSFNRMEGIVQICAHGYWGTICDNSYSWDSRSADVVCNQLGYTTHGAIPISRWLISAALRFPIWLDSVRCTGSEPSLLDCTHSVIGDINTFCDHYDDVYVRCWDPVTSATPCTNGTVRLVGGTTSYEGRVEICYRNQWGTVCDDSWSTADAQVVCRQLGLTMTGALAYSYAYYGQGYGGIFLDNVACSGNENRLLDCISSSRIGVHNCQHNDDAGVKCRGTPMLNCTHGDIRLESGRNDREGTLRVCIGGTWSTVCNSGWDSQDAAIACRQLGFPTSAAIPLLRTRSGRGTGRALVSNFACSGQESSLLSCRHTLMTSSCTYTYFVGVQCLDPVNATTPCYDGELRLAGGTVANEGRVELCYQNQWGTICRDGWSVSDARVSCRQLGYSTLGAVIKTFEGGEGAIFLESLRCSGTESTLIECRHSPINVHNCDHTDDAGVLCNLPEECTNGDAVLLFGPNSSEGTVEVCVSGYWSTVCSTNWDSREAGIVCQQLGLPSLGAIPVFSATYVYGSNADRPIVLRGFQCTGSEENLLSCPRYSINSATCSHGSDVGVQCPEIVNVSCATGSVRLADGHHGRVEICYQEQWGTVCDDGWSSTDARVVCNQLGYSPFGAAILTRGQYQAGSGPIFLDNVGCHGTESSLLECYHPGIGVHNCQHDDDVGIECLSPDNCTHGEVHLLFGSNEREGTVEVCVHGYWGTICDNGWDSRDARVICRQLGYLSLNFGAIPYFNSFFGQRNGPIMLDSVFCNSAESTIVNCTHNGFGITSPYCDHGDDAGVQCLRINNTEPCTTGNIRLISAGSGESLIQGRVEICYQNIWGTVCDDSWSDVDARVVCRVLGYPPLGAIAYSNSRFGNGMGVIFLDNVACRGIETSLLSCSHSGIGVHNCDHTDDAGVACNSYTPTNCTEGDVRLTGSRSSNPREGTVEICVNGYWGTICSNGWDSRDAMVICSTLGYPSLGPIPYRYSYFGYGTGPVILDSVNCIGNESRITQCAHLGVGATASYCYHYYDVGVQCPDPINSNISCSDGDIRLAGGLLENQGRVEICYQNQWGTVCHDSWSDADARVVCRQLGYSPLGAISYSNSRFGNGMGPILLDNLYCRGNESTLLGCTHPGLGVHNCNHAQDAGVACIRITSTITPSSEENTNSDITENSSRLSKASASMNTITIPSPVISSASAAFFQLRLRPVSDCVTWTDSLQEEKLNSIRDGVLAAVESLCSCSLPVNSIHGGVFSCRNTNTAIVFKAHISIINNLMSANQMLRLLSKWAKTSPSIIVLRTLLQVDPTCPTELETLLGDDCQVPLVHSEIQLHSITVPYQPDTEQTGNATPGIAPIPIIGTAVGVLVIVIVVIITVIGCIVLHKTKRSNNHRNWSPCHQLELSEYSEGIKLRVSMANNPAYELPSDSFSVNNPAKQDHKPSSKVLSEEDHEYDYIPATFSGRQHAYYDEPAHDDIPIAKKDGVPQISSSKNIIPSSDYEIPFSKDW